MQKDKKIIFVVLGMHRSGTSAITRGLEVLGASLGNRLMPPFVGNNDKGFFEDVDINAFNIEGRYPEEKMEFHQKITCIYAKKWLKIINELYLWLLSK